MIKFTKDGRELPIGRFADELHAEIVRAARAGIEERARTVAASLRCPEHGLAVRAVRVDYSGGKEGTINAAPCCEAMATEVDHAIRTAFESEQ